MGRNNSGKGFVPAPAKKRKDPGVPKFAAVAAKKEAAKVEQKTKEKERWREKARLQNPQAQARTFASISTTQSSYNADTDDQHASGSGSTENYVPLDPSIMLKDSSAKAFMNHLRKVIDQSDVVIQVLDARDPLGGRSKYVEDEVRRREGDGKKLIAVMNKIDLVPRPTVESWLRYLRHDFPTLPFKSSTQSQRTHISSLHLPTSSAANPAAPTTTPVTSLALGAAPLIQLLKSYARHLPTGQSLTVGVVGFPNVGKSSLINSLKRSRACGVAATPGKTRVVQEVALDKGVKILDCPGIVFDPAGEDPGLTEEERRKKRGEVILRNCVKAELVEDVISPVEIIMTKVDHAQLEKLYAVPPFESVTQLLVSIALVRGRLGKGGVPDLESSAVQVLRDWNTGKIAYHTTPPAVHHSMLLRAAHAKAPTGPVAEGSAVRYESEAGQQTGDAAIVKEFAPAFDLGGLMGEADREVFSEIEREAMDVEAGLGEDGEEMPMEEEDEGLDEAWGGLEDYVGLGVLKEDDVAVVEQKRKMTEEHEKRERPAYPDTVLHKSKTAAMNRLFTPDEMANMALNNPISRKNLKAERKRKDKELKRLMDFVEGGDEGGEGSGMMMD